MKLNLPGVCDHSLRNMEETGRDGIVTKHKFSLCFKYNEFYAHCPMDLNSKFKSNAVTKWLGRDLQISTLITIPDPQSVYLARLSSSASSTKYMGKYRQSISSLLLPPDRPYSEFL